MRMKPTPPVLLYLLVVLGWPMLASGQPPEHMNARLDLVRNGKMIGETTFVIRSDGEQWRMESSSRGTKGLARFIGLDESSFSEGDWHGDEARPVRFERELSAIKSYRWSATFDWEAGTVHSVHPDGENDLPLEAGVVDQTALGLVIQWGLVRGETEWALRVLDEDEIEDQLFRVITEEPVQTGLGCLDAVRVDKIRAAESKRYTRTWYARDYNFAPVRIEHGKEGGDRFESRLQELVLENEAVPRRPDC